MSTSSRKPRYRTEWVERWCPPKPLVGVRPVEKVLNRHTVVACPESRLVVAVIVRAIDDCLAHCTKPRRQARRFLLGDELIQWCDLVGLNPEFVRFVAQRAGYLADEKAHWQKVPIKVPVLPVPNEPVVSASSAPVHSITCHAHTHPPQGGLIHA